MSQPTTRHITSQSVSSPASTLAPADSPSQAAHRWQPITARPPLTFHLDLRSIRRPTILDAGEQVIQHLQLAVQARFHIVHLSPTCSKRLGKSAKQFVIGNCSWGRLSGNINIWYPGKLLPLQPEETQSWIVVFVVSGDLLIKHYKEITK